MMSQNQPKSKANIYRSPRWKHDHSRFKGKEEPAKPICRIAHTCKACKYINQSYELRLQEKYQLGLNHLKSLSLIDDAQITPVVASPKSLEYRCHAKLAVRPYRQALNNKEADKRFAIGMFQPNSHKIVDISYCPLHRQSINRLIIDLKAALEASSLKPYDESTHQGDLRYLAIRASHLTAQLMVTFVCTSDSKKHELKAMILKLRNMGHTISSAHVNINPDKTNTIFGTLSKRLVGADRLREELCDLSFEIGPTSFFQVNPWQAELIYRRVAHIAGQDRAHSVAWDLYCGTGQISMLLAMGGFRTIGVEENPQATRDAQKNVVRNQLENLPQFMAGRVESISGNFPSWAEAPKLVVVNPARKGLSEEVREFLKETLINHEPRIIYVSCEMETLARDLADLVKTGKKVRQIEAFDMFPHTEKMEWLAVLD